MSEAAQTPIELLTQKLAELAGQIADGAGPAGKAAWEATMVALRIEALAGLGIGFAAAGLAIVLARVALRHAAAIKSPSRRGEDMGVFVANGSGVPAAVTVLSTISGIISTLVAVNYLASPSVWVTVISPQAGLALRILN